MKTESKQVVVIAAGPAGLAAAIAAVENGVDAKEVIILEKTKMNISTPSSGPFFVPTLNKTPVSIIIRNCVICSIGSCSARLPDCAVYFCVPFSADSRYS